MYMHTYTQTYMYTYTYKYTCTYTRIHAHTCTYVCICTRMHRCKPLSTTPQHVKLYHRRTYVSICICMHIHTYIHIHICVQPAASVSQICTLVTHLCNIHTCPCTSAQNTCKVHVTLTAKKCTNTYTYTHMHTHTYAHENTCTCMTPSTR